MNNTIMQTIGGAAVVAVIQLQYITKLERLVLINCIAVEASCTLLHGTVTRYRWVTILVSFLCYTVREIDRERERERETPPQY